MKVFGNWLQAEELAEASALRALRRPRVPDKLIEPVPDDTLRLLLGLASVRDRAILLLLPAPATSRADAQVDRQQAARRGGSS